MTEGEPMAAACCDCSVGTGWGEEGQGSVGVGKDMVLLTASTAVVFLIFSSSLGTRLSKLCFLLQLL